MKKHVVLLSLLLSTIGVANSQNLPSGMFLGKDSESKILRPPQGSAPISKREYEENLKKQGKTLEGELVRVSGDKVISADGFIGPAPKGPVDASGLVDLETVKKKKQQQDLQTAKDASKINGVEDGNNGEMFEKTAQEKMDRAILVLKELTMNMYTKDISLIDYEKLEMQNKIMSLLVEAQYSKEITKKSSDIKIQVLNLLRQMYPFIINDTLKGYDVVSLGNDYKVLKVYSKSMNSKEVMGLNAIITHAFGIGFDKIYFTDNNKYYIEETLKSYINRTGDVKN